MHDAPNDSTLPFLLVDLGADVTKVSQVLGAMGDAILAGRGKAIVLELGDNAVDPNLLGKLLGWFRRNETLLRTRTVAFVCVVPRFRHALQWRLATWLDPPPVVHSTIARTRAEAAAWIATRAT